MPPYSLILVKAVVALLVGVEDVLAFLVLLPSALGTGPSRCLNWAAYLQFDVLPVASL